MSDKTIDAFDAGLLNDFGGGNTEWWMDYIRSLLGQAHDHYVAQIDSIAALKWQDISTAPRDGTSILVCGGEAWILTMSHDRDDAWKMVETQIARWTNGRVEGWQGAYDGEDGYFWYEPTHWMPIPAARSQGARMADPLWCITVQGPDDVIPAHDYNDARKRAMAMNSAFLPNAEKCDVMWFAYPAEWPGTAEEHARYMRTGSVEPPNENRR